MNRKILALATAFSLALGLGAFVATRAPSSIPGDVAVQNYQYCQVCQWIWSHKAQKYVRSCTLVVCHAV